jgi:SLT domain-containing protein
MTAFIVVWLGQIVSVLASSMSHFGLTIWMYQQTESALAMGLMQVMPGTYRELAQRYNLGPDPYHPYDNLQAGAAYLREMYQLYGNPAFLAAYNAGPRRLEDYLWGGRGLPDETRNYVARVGPRIASTAPAFDIRLSVNASRM